MIKQDCPLAPGSVVWPYLRVSGEEQARRVTPIASMKKDGVDYCKEHNLIIGRWFIDEAIPGESTAKRDDFNRMIAEAHRDPPDAILLWSWSRFSRDSHDAHFFKADLRRRGIEVISISDAVPTGEYQYIFEALIHWKDERRRQEISSGVKRTFRLLAEAGYVPGGFPPRGYKIERVTTTIDGHPKEVKKWVKDAQWWDLAKKAWEMKSAGASYQEIIDATGLYRGKNCLPTFFRNSAYRGTVFYGGIPIAIRRMVSDETWQAAQRQMDARSRRHEKSPKTVHRRNVSSDYLLSGLLVCGHCGSAIVGSRIPPRDLADGHRSEWRYYICGRKKREGYPLCPSGTIKAEIIEEAVLDKVCGEILTPRHLVGLVDKIMEDLGAKDDMAAQKRRVQQELKRVERSTARLLDAIEQRGYGGLIEQRLSAREAERRELEEQIHELAQKEKLLSASLFDKDISARLMNLRATIETGNVASSRGVLKSFIQRIEVKDKEATMYYIPP